MKRQLVENYRNIQPSNITVIPNSVDTSSFTPREHKDRSMVLFTGRLIAAKGLTFLIRAVPAIIKQHPNTKFVFIGPGDPSPYMKELRRLRISCRNYSFIGYLKDRLELLDYYRRCTVFVAPTLYENLPTRILEAMACGKTVVASDVCAISEAITSERDGILVPPKSSQALSEAITRLLARPKLRARIGTRARRKVVAEFDWTTNARRTADFYSGVLASF
jgi:glycosyltransferase involved in cell wall biosynthesis